MPAAVPWMKKFTDGPVTLGRNVASLDVIVAV
jgi:hypothetical protein